MVTEILDMSIQMRHNVFHVQITLRERAMMGEGGGKR